MNGELRTTSQTCVQQPFSKCKTCHHDRGYIQVYTGDGKGKTTAAIGLAVRALGAGKSVFIGQFLKGQAYSEIKALQQFMPGIIIEQYGLRCFVNHNPKPEDIQKAQLGLQRVKTVLQSRTYDLVILDEINVALFYELFLLEEFIEILKGKNCSTEVILTGRYAHPQVLELADLVTDMTEVKHYYKNGIYARDGIER